MSLSKGTFTEIYLLTETRKCYLRAMVIKHFMQKIQPFVSVWNRLGKAPGTLLRLWLCLGVHLSMGAVASSFATASDDPSAGKQDERAIDSPKNIIETANHDTSICSAYISWGEEVYLQNSDTALILWQKAHDLAEKNLADAPPTTLEKKFLGFLSEALNNIGYIYYMQGDNPKAMEHHQKSLKIKEGAGNKVGIASSLNNMGLIYQSQGDISNALACYQRCMKLNEETGNKKGIAYYLNNIGVIYQQQGDIPLCLEYLHKSLRIREKLNNKSEIAYSLNNIGLIYRLQGDATKALEYFEESLGICEKVGNKVGSAQSLNNMGMVYDDLGDITQALAYFQKCKKIYEETGSKIDIASSLNNIGVIYKRAGDIPKALEYLYKGLKIEEDIGNVANIAIALCNIGWLELSQGALERARKKGTQGLLIAREIGSPDLISDNSDLLSKVAKKQAILATNPALRQAKYQEALEMYELHVKMRDSIKNEETLKATIRQQTKYEFEKVQLVKEQEEIQRARVEDETRSRRDNLQYSIVLIGLMVIGLMVAMLGRLSVPDRVAEGLIFFSFLIFFEFMLVLADPYIENWSSGAPGIKLLFNATIAALIFPLHAFFEASLKGRLVKSQ